MASYSRSASDHDVAPEAIPALTGFIDENTLLDLARRFSATYTNLARTSTEHFLVTPVTALPTGKEKGTFLSIDVGGTNLRVGIVQLLGDLDDLSNSNSELKKDDSENVFAKIRRSHDRDWPIGDHLKMDKAEDLFAWIADCIAEVVREAIASNTVTAGSTSPSDDEILLGITFSFPMA
jgi:hexokinase